MRKMLTDSHVHITPPEVINNQKMYRRQDPYFDLLCGSPVHKNITGKQLIAYMDKVKIERTVVFGFAFKNNELCRRVNDYTIKMVKKYDRRLIGFAVVNPRGKDVISELERCKEGGLQGVGELFATGQEFKLTEKGVLAPVANFCQDNNWPCLIHLNEPVGHEYRGKTADSLQEGIALAENFPRVNFILAHLGGGLCFYELMPEIRELLENVYYDTAAIPFLYENRIYNTLKQVGVLDKILLGTDYPLLGIEKYLAGIDNSILSPREKAQLKGGNLKRLLNF